MNLREKKIIAVYFLQQQHAYQTQGQILKEKRALLAQYTTDP